MRTGLTILFFNLTLWSVAQCPITSFNIPTTACINENILVENNSVDATYYQWDFCTNDNLEVDPEVTEIASGENFGQSNYIKIIKDNGQFYGFVPLRRNSDKLVRLDFGNSLDGEPEYYDLGDFEGLLDDPVDIALIKESDSVWRGLMSGLTSDKLYLLEFNDGIAYAPQITDISGNLNLSRPNSLDIVHEGGNYYAFLVNNENGNYPFVRLNFGGSLASATTTAPSETEITISGSDNLTSISLIKECDTWYGFLVSRDNANIYRADFDGSITNSPTFTEVTSGTGVTLDDPGGIAVVQEGDSNYVFVQSRNGPLYRLSFGESFGNAASGVDLGNIYGDTETWGLEFIKLETDWIGFNANFNGKIYRLDFPADCQSSISTSKSFEPSGLSYASSGDYTISLKTIDDNGNVDIKSQSITISSDIAPDIDFEIDDNRCTSNSNGFTVSGDLVDIDTYSWDFDGDNVEDSTNPNPTFQFTSAGNYKVTLNIVGLNGCTNNVVKEIVIYEEPPTPSFEIEESVLCTNRILTFTNTTNETGYDNILSYEWDLDGEEISNQKDTVFVFDTSGEKTISLQSFLPGCSSEVTASTITVNAGPEVDFSWDNNCFREKVQFTNESVGTNIEGYEWSFGDSTNSTMENPSHEYMDEDTFAVSLSVHNAFGCETTLIQDVIVYSGSIADFVASSAVENEPVLFNGYDSTSNQDSVTSWDWDFDGMGQSNEQNPIFTFSLPQTYTISLMVETAQGCSKQIVKELSVGESECPTANFEAPTSVCVGEKVMLSNISVNSELYQWDFCSNDNLESISGVNRISSDNDFGLTNYIKIIKEEGVYHGFVPGRTVDRIIRLDFGNSLASEPSYNDLGNLDGILDDPVDIGLIKESDGVWRGLLTGLTSNKLYLIEFSSGITKAPNVMDISGDLNLRRPNSVNIIEESGNYYAFVINNENGSYPYIRLDFGNSLSTAKSTPPVETEFTVPGGNTLTTQVLIKECNEWYGFLVSRSNARIYRAHYGSSITNSPTFTEISSDIGVTLNDPGGIAAVQEGDSSYVFVQSRNGPLYRLSFGESFSYSVFGEDLGNIYGDSETWGLEFVKDGTDWFGFNANFSGKIYRFEFSSECHSSLPASTSFEPANLSYSSSGEYTISLRAIDEDGYASITSQSVIVSSEVAPDINFSIDESRCIDNPNTFSSIDEGDITTYSWDFNADGIEDSSDPNPTYQFPSAGTYTVRLDVQSDEGCGNFVEEEITIYPEPPVPVFSVSATTYCVGSEILFTNETNDSAYDGLVDYHWSVTDLSDTTTNGDLSATFETSGQKIISVYSSIPGCESAVTRDTITIQASPNVDFSTTPVCHGDLTTFTNGSDTGDYLWDFGDDFTSTTRDPDHLYSEPGTYNVTLTVTNANGCSTTQQKQVVVSALPDPGFEYTLLCEGDSTVLQDVSIVDNSNVVAWEWYVEDQLVSQVQSPEVTFSSEGTQTVRLVVYADNGCEASYSQSVQVLAMPDVDFDASLACQSEVSTFTDATANPDQIAGRTWMVDGELIDATGEETLSYAFAEPGPHEVTLIIDNQNLCSGTYTRTVEIPEPPGMDVEIDGSCKNDVITARDLSSVADDEISSRKWLLDGVLVGNGNQILLPVTDAGQHEVVLEVETAFGCTYQLSRLFESHAAPLVDFWASNDYGVPPFAISFTNYTQNGSVYRWFVDDTEVSSAAEPTLSFTETGEKVVRLVAENANGCVDSASMVISSVLPEIDVSLNQLQLVDNGGVQQILMNISNQSNLPIEQMQATITLDNNLTITENITRRINVGQETVISLNLGLPAQQSNINYLCVTLATTYAVADKNATDNENCISIEPDLVVEPPYPNPARDHTTLRAVLPTQSDVKLTVIDMTGQIRYETLLRDLPAGLNAFTYDLLRLEAGTYFISIQYQGGAYRSRIIKQ